MDKKNERRLIVALLSSILMWAAASVDAAPPDDPPVRLLEGLGTLHMPITTQVPATQDYFDQGLRLFYAFNFDESVRSFREAARLDPTCSMCHWGIALSLGPNINAPMDPRRGRDAHRAIQRAIALMPAASAREQAFISALSTRYHADPSTERASLDRAYASAMARVAARFPQDAEAAVIHAAAIMNLSPWDYWNTDRSPRPGIQPVLTTLSVVVAREPDHAGACHFYIHLVEAAWPERAVPCADRLPDLMPGAGHIVHMPAHVYIRVGRYEDAIERNLHAVHADERYIADQRPSGEYPLAYYPHNYHFLAFAATMAAEADTALEAARSVAVHTDRTLLDDPDLGGTLQHFLTTEMSTLARFARWPEVLQHPPFDDHLAYPRGHWHFARGMAFVATDRLDEAGAELDALRELVNDPATAAVVIFGINTGPQVLAVAERVLAGRLLAARGEVNEAVDVLRTGIEREDALTYNEPPDWNLPVRQVLAAVLHEAGRLDEAAAAYEADLEKYPGNRWSRDGLAALGRAR